LREARAQRRIVRVGIEKRFILHRYGGCDDATCETSSEAEACDQGRGAGVGRCRFDFRAGRKRLRISHADRGCPAKTQLRADPSCHTRRRRNRRRQPRDVPPVRQGKQRQRVAADGVGLPMRRLRLPRLRRLSLRRLRLPLRWRLRLRCGRLLRNLGFLPLLLNRCDPSDCGSKIEQFVGRARYRPRPIAVCVSLGPMHTRACCRRASVLPTNAEMLARRPGTDVERPRSFSARRVPETIGETCVLTR
jgi:hypothetical protein